MVCTLRRSTNGGSTTTSTALKCSSLRLNAIFWVSAIASRWFRFIFQLPAMSGLRRGEPAAGELSRCAGKSDLFQNGDAGQGLAFEELERRTASGRDVPVGEAVEPERTH